MKKDIEWLKEELLGELMLFNGNPNMTDYESGIASGIMTAINLTEKLDEPEQTDTNVGLSKPVIPQFVADWIESQDDPIYEMCVNYEMWGVNGDDGTTRFTGEIAEWFDDTLNVENYYRACIDGYEVEKEPHYCVAFEGEFNLLYVTHVDIYGEYGKFNYSSVFDKKHALKFTDKSKAEYLADFLGAIVVEVTE